MALIGALSICYSFQIGVDLCHIHVESNNFVRVLFLCVPVDRKYFKFFICVRKKSEFVTPSIYQSWGNTYSLDVRYVNSNTK